MPSLILSEADDMGEDDDDNDEDQEDKL